MHQALARELDEELGVRLADSFPWFVKEHRYEHAAVRRISAAPATSSAKRFQGKARISAFMRPMNARRAFCSRWIRTSSIGLTFPDVWEDSTAVLTLSENALHATVVRDRKYRFVGARAAILTM